MTFNITDKEAGEYFLFLGQERQFVTFSPVADEVRT